VELIPSATLDYVALTQRLGRDPSLFITIHSRGRHLCRCIRACGCLVPRQYVGERIHVGVTSTLPNQSSRNCISKKSDHDKEKCHTVSFTMPPTSRKAAISKAVINLGRGNQSKAWKVSRPTAHKLAFLTISTSPPMLSSPSLSRSIAVWKVNFCFVRVRTYRPNSGNDAHPD
jgi:hypothetical protein